MNSNARGFLLALGASAALSACSFALDPDVLKEDDAGEGEQRGPRGLGGDDGVIGGGNLDAGAWMAPDASDPFSNRDATVLPNPCDYLSVLCTPDASSEDAMAPQRACTKDEECTSGQICSVSKECVARCTAELGCAGPVQTGMNGQAREGNRVVYMLPPARDQFNNAVGSAGIYSWDLRGQPQRISDLALKNEADFVGIASGYYYLRLDPKSIEYQYPDRAAGPLVRQSLDGTSAEVIDAGNVTASWITPQFVWWVRVLSDKNEELWRLRHGSTAPAELIGKQHDARWTAGNDMYVFSSDRRRQQVNDLSVSAEIDYWKSSVVDDEYLYNVYGISATLTRVDGHGSGTALNLHAPGNVYAMHVEGDWVYWSGSASDGTQRFRTYGRSHRDMAVPPQEWVRAPTKDGGFGYPGDWVTAIGDSAVWWSIDENRFFVKKLPPLHCSAEVGCASGTACGNDNLCH